MGFENPCCSTSFNADVRFCIFFALFDLWRGGKQLATTSRLPQTAVQYDTATARYRECFCVRSMSERLIKRVPAHHPPPTHRARLQGVPSLATAPQRSVLAQGQTDCSVFEQFGAPLLDSPSDLTSPSMVRHVIQFNNVQPVCRRGATLGQTGQPALDQVKRRGTWQRRSTERGVL